MGENIVDNLKIEIDRAYNALLKDLAKTRTIQATARMLESLPIDAYGQPTPLREIARISIPAPNLIVVKPIDIHQLVLVQKAIANSNMGIKPQNDGTLINIPIPVLTEEQRKEGYKLTVKYGEDCKLSIRSLIRDAKDKLEISVRNKSISADEGTLARKQIEA